MINARENPVVAVACELVIVVGQVEHDAQVAGMVLHNNAAQHTDADKLQPVAQHRQDMVHSNTPMIRLLNHQWHNQPT